MKKTQIIILISLAVVVAVLSAVFIAVFMKVDSVKYTVTATFTPFEYRDGLLVSQAENKAMRFVSNMGTYREAEIGIFEVQNYDGAADLGLETVVACVDGDNLIPITDNAMPYYNLDGCFVYGTKGTEKHLVDTENHTVAPLLERSSAHIEGVSTNGEFLLENDGKNVTVLRRKDRTTSEIISETSVDFGGKYNEAVFVAWYNERYALMRLNKPMTTTFGIIDGENGTFTELVTTCDVPSVLTYDDDENNDMVQCYNNLVGDRYLQCYEITPNVTTGESEMTRSGKFLDIFTGATYGVELDLDLFVGKNELVAVSRDGSYAAFKTSLTDRGDLDYVVVNAENGKYVTMGEILGDDAFVDDVCFTYNNVLFVNYAEMTTGVEASCSIKLSF